jgi:hypothetical protein
MPSIGASLFMVAVGAILRYAVSDAVKGVSLPTIGLILMIIGIVGLAISLFMYFAGTRRTAPPPRYGEPDPYADRYPDRAPGARY